jgi:tetratricopeptide (TPR) repeat protein
MLNRSATRCATQTLEGHIQLEVLSWGTLAAFHQRHISHSIVNAYDVMKNKWAVADRAKEFRQSVEQLLGQMTLFPIVEKMIAVDSPDFGEAVAKAAAFAREHPELVTSVGWAGWSVKSKTRTLPLTPPEAGAWFSDSPPMGTIYDFRFRNRRFQTQRDPPAQLAELAPYNYDVLHANMMKKFPVHHTAEETAACFAAIKDFDIYALFDIADQCTDRPELYGKVMNQICALQPDYYVNLGLYYIDKQMAPEAAAALQAAFDRAADRVYVANNCGWLVSYYFDNGRRDEAMKIATDAAEAYSYSGLQTMATLLEKMGRLREAEDYYKKIRERYSESYELDGFYVRHQGEDPAYARIAAQQTAMLFPSGLQKVNLQDFSAAPVDGVLIKTSSDKIRRANLWPGNIIVAIDGVRVHSQPQYFHVRGLTLDPNMALIVWNGREYVERRINTPGRRLKCDLEDFKAQSGANR